MTDREALLLALGVNFGVFATLAVHFVGQALGNRREARADRAALSKARKIRATADWRDALAARKG